MRGKHESIFVGEYLQQFFSNVPLHKIDSVFGFVERCSLYGGRVFKYPQISDRDVQWLNENNIGLRIPLTNHFVKRYEYNFYQALLEKYHHPLNSVIITEDKLAGWIKKDFPLYTIEASVIKNINSIEKLEKAWPFYDTVVLPMPCNDDIDFLKSIDQKERIRLFANAGCAYTCPSRICYRSFSQVNKFGGAKSQCSIPLKERDAKGMIDFDLQPFIELGFHQFKLLRERLSGQTGY
jgi:hypothetical protein